jgi:hypothetical protein
MGQGSRQKARGKAVALRAPACLGTHGQVTGKIAQHRVRTALRAWTMGESQEKPDRQDRPDRQNGPDRPDGLALKKPEKP